METAALVALYAQAAQGCEEEVMKGGSKKQIDRHHSIGMRALAELKKRGNERELLGLLEHPHANVRQWAAAAALSFAPDVAIPILEKLVQNAVGVPSLNARITLQLWHDGKWSG